MSKSNRIAAIDIGGNDVKLLIMDDDIVIKPLTAFPTGLRYAVDTDGSLKENEYKRTVDAFNEINELLTEYVPDDVRITSCSAAREMNPGTQRRFAADVKRILKSPLHILPGTIEASLGFMGAVSSLHADEINEGTNIITIDVGGGSTEIAMGTADRASSFQSIPLGGNTLKMINGTDGTVNSAVIRTLPFMDKIEASFKTQHSTHNQYLLNNPSLIADGNPLTVDDSFKYIIIGGAATTLSAWMHGIDSTDPYLTDGYSADTVAIINAARHFSKLSDKERLESGCVLKGRETSIWCSALIIAEVLKTLGAPDATVSAHGLIDALIDDKCWHIVCNESSFSACK